MINSYTRIASFVLAFGFFFGCSTTENTSNSTNNPSSGNISEAQFEQHITAIDEQLKSEQFNPALYYKKGEILVKWARKKGNPVRRTPLYIKADLAFQKADSLLRTRSDVQVDTLHYDQLRKVAWSSEHNQGIEYSQNASSEEDYQQAAIHFNNAAAVMSDKAISYQMASKAYYNGNKLQMAISVLERARTNIAPPPVNLLESLAFLYVETDQLPKAINTYKQAISRRKHSFNLMHGLSNAYIEAGDHHNAISILQQLADRKPGNPTYRYSLASEFYKAGRDKIIAMVDELEDNDTFNSAAFSLADSLFNQAENHYRNILDRQPENTRFLYETIQFYHNKAAQYQRLLSYLNAEKKTEIKNYIKNNISASVPLLEQLTEHRPTEQFWKYLYRTYSYLGMQEKAEKAKANY